MGQLKIACSIIFLLFASCQYSQKNIIGSYKSKQVSSIESIIHYKTLFANGSELSLYSDSSFIYSTCGNISKGIWENPPGDTLYLSLKEFRYRNDSLNNVRNTKFVGFKYKFYKCSNGDLRNETYSNYSKETDQYLIEQLSKIE